MCARVPRSIAAKILSILLSNESSLVSRLLDLVLERFVFLGRPGPRTCVRVLVDLGCRPAREDLLGVLGGWSCSGGCSGRNPCLDLGRMGGLGLGPVGALQFTP